MPATKPDPALRGLVSRLMREEFTRTQWLWVEGHLRILVDLRKAFGNDLDTVIILAVIGQQMLGDPALADWQFEALGTEIPPIKQQRLTNIGSVAAATGIPRESVRRKVDELVQAGWVARDPGGFLSVASSASGELSPSTLIAINMLDGLFAQFATMLSDRGWIELRKLPAATPATGDGTTLPE